MNITCQNLYHMPYQPSTYITPRAGGPWHGVIYVSRVDTECDTDFDMYYSVCNTRTWISNVICYMVPFCVQLR